MSVADTLTVHSCYSCKIFTSCCSFGCSCLCDSLRSCCLCCWNYFRSFHSSLLSKQSVKALVAIRFLPLLLEGALIQLLQAEAADKMLWMEFAEHGSDTAARDCLMTASAKTATKCMVVLFTVGEAFVLKKVAVMERHLTLLAHETVGMPLQVERRDVVLSDRGVATPALGGKLFKVAGLAKRCVVFLMKAVVSELVAAF